MALRKILFLCFLALVGTEKVRQNSAIEELEKYIEDKKTEINPRYRLHYHVAGPVGWINDPNGFSFYKGEYHLFYQFYPYDSVWGPMHWGHVKSKDLVTWEQLPVALIPEEEQCFSGSAVVDGDNLTLIYTANIEIPNEISNQSQYLAFSSDGVHFEKYEGNPVIAAAPNGSPDFRDPKAWKYEGFWYVVIGSKTDDNRGRVLLYRSVDMINWEFLTVLAESDGSLGYMWECPDFFELDGKFVLLMSPQGIEPEGDRYKNVHQTGYIIGSFNYNTFEFVPEVDFQEMDYGHDFYAAQTTENKGRRYVVGWFNMWDNPHPEDVDGWAGAMTIVRELSISNNRIIMTPVEDMVSLRQNIVHSGPMKTNKAIVFGKAVELNLEPDLNRNVELQLEGADGGEVVWVKWNTTSSIVTVDRGDDDVRQVEWKPLGARSWRLFLDASSLELFCGDGEVVFSSRVYPEGGWKVANLSPVQVPATVYSLRRSVPV
ncbi:sucrose-6-phosphate hydrolase [Phthorimaea operculella]|nr:sucrose-6-phosphate hydrolase [Phthorimaea operculella]